MRNKIRFLFKFQGDKFILFVDIYFVIILEINIFFEKGYIIFNFYYII